MKTIANYMSRTPQTIAADQSLAVAREMMRALDVRHLPVLDGGRLVGVVTDGDHAVSERLRACEPTMRALMNPSPYSASPHTPLRVVAAEMAMRRLDVAVVLEEGRVVGILTAVDLARALHDALAADVSNASADRFGAIVET